MSRPKYWWYDYVKKSIMHSRERVEAYRGTHAATESPEMV